MKHTLLLCPLFILMGRIQHVDSPGSFQIICPEPSVKAVAGHPVILQCYTNHQINVSRVEWLVNGTVDVHLFRKGGDHYDNQSKTYKGKTSLLKNELSRGNFSLNLTAEMSHSGTYRCCVYAKEDVQECFINVTVHEAEKNISSQNLQEDTTSPDNPNNGTDGLTLKVVLGVVVVVLGIIIALVVYPHRERLMQLCSRRNSNTSQTHQRVSYQPAPPPQDQEDEPVDPNEERIQIDVNEEEDAQADGNM